MGWYTNAVLSVDFHKETAFSFDYKGATMATFMRLGFLLLLPLGFVGGYTAGPYITPIKPERVVNKALHSPADFGKMSFESAVKRTD